MSSITGLADYKRVQLFEHLAEYLHQRPTSEIPDRPFTYEGLRTFAFFESCFLNALEGNSFTIEQALPFLLDEPPEEPEAAEAHILTGTYFFVIAQHIDPIRPRTPAAFIDLLQDCHTAVEHGNPADRPGEFKTVTTRFGSTIFSKPDELEETLKRGFNLLDRVADPFSQAALMVAIITETHPFLHGSGKVALLMMNRLLLQTHRHPVLLPPALRHFYVAALKRLSQHDDIEALMRILEHAQRYSASIPWQDFNEARTILEETGAFDTGHDARLLLPAAT
ncbi:MAG: Fic family protein [Pseudomonadota bacterium]